MNPQRAKDKDAFDWDQLEDIRANQSLVPPTKAFTVNEYARRYGVGRSSANEQLLKLVASGKLDKIKCGMRSYFRYKESSK